MLLSKIFLCLATLAIAMAETLIENTYDGWKVVRASIVHEKQLNMISEMGLDVWSRDGILTMGDNDIRVTDKHVQMLGALKVDFEYLIEDLEALMVQERAALSNRSQAPNWFTAYHSYAEQVAYLQSLAQTYPTLIKFTSSIGKSVQSRDIPLVVLTGAAANNKKKVFFSAQQHAREWIASATAIYLIDQLASTYSTDPAVKKILDGTVIHFVPLVNPDGYNYTWTKDRLWRKNRRSNSDGTYGVDLNRNWDDHWGGAGTSHNPSSDVYCGTKAFSEPEAAVVSQYVTAQGSFDASIDWHSYSQLVLRPYGWTSTPPSNDAELTTVGAGIVKAIAGVHKMKYENIPSIDLYPTTGTAQDWYFTEADIPLSYTIELRDTGKYGFVLPADQIIPTGDENLAGMKYFLNYLLSN